MRPSNQSSWNVVMRLGTIGVLAALVAACAPAPMPIAQSSRDPSNPSAPEGSNPEGAATATETMETSRREHHHHGAEHAMLESPARHEGHVGPPAASDAGPQGVIYVCPMDPEIRSNTAGVCPKCNMKLVPQK